MLHHNYSFKYPCPSIWTFYKCWKQDFSHVKIPKIMAFSKGTGCVKYMTIIANTKDPTEKLSASAKLATHHQRVATERHFTLFNLAKSRTDEGFLFCEIGGIQDQCASIGYQGQEYLA